MREFITAKAAILAGRILLLALAAGAVVVGFVVSREHAGGTEITYICPMHPEVKSPVPGDCPICRMSLEPAVRPSSTSDHSAHGTDDSAPVSFSLPPGARITKFEDLGYSKLHEMSREMRAPARAESRESGVALLYEDEVALLAPDEQALFFPAPRGGEMPPPGIPVRRVAEPPSRWDSTTSLVRFRVEPDAELTPDQVGTVKFATRVHKGLAVRATAVLRSPDGPHVLMAAPDNRTFTKRSIQIGSVRFGHANVISGLKPGEKIAAQKTFFLEAERHLAQGAQP